MADAFEAHAFEERRRTPRAVVRGSGRCEMTTWSTTRMLDVGPCGALLASRRPVDAVERVELRAAFDCQPFNSTVEIRWAQGGESGLDAGPVRLGVRFVDVDDSSQRALDRFLRKATL